MTHSRTIFLLSCSAAALALAPADWRLLSSNRGELPPPNGGRQQTSAVVFDIDGDGVNDFVIMERTQAPAVVWYQRRASGWTKHILEAGQLPIEAGATFGDVDGDGDPDLLAGGDYRSNEVWWWENPRPEGDPRQPWKRRALKASGANKHHDLLYADLDGDGRGELYFWNQGAQTLFQARPPAGVRSVAEWPRQAIYEYSSDSEMPHRGAPPHWRKVNEHEGLCVADIDLDGRPDLIGGGRWLQRLPDGSFRENLIDAAFPFSRCAVGQFIEGGRPEVVLSLGDGAGPMVLYEWQSGAWTPRILLDGLDNAHTLQAGDFDLDGHPDLFVAEMRLDGGNEKSRMMILYGNGKGEFRTNPAWRISMATAAGTSSASRTTMARPR